MTLQVSDTALALGTKRNSERTILAALVQSFLLFGVKYGLDPAALCARAGIRMADLADADKQVPHAWFFGVRKAIIDALPDEHVGIALGTFVTPDQMGYLGQAVKHGATGFEVVRLIIRSLRLVDSVYEQHPVTLDVAPPEARITVSAEALGPPDPPDCVESLFVNSVHSLKQLTGRDVVPRSVCFAHHRSEAVQQRLNDYFRCPVRFGGDQHVLILDSELLEVPCIGADSRASQHFEAQIIRLLNDRQEPFVTQVEHLVASRLATGDFSQERVARALAMSTRSLQRRLKDHGDGFHELLQRVRRRMAEGLLRDGTAPIFEVAFALGYDDVSSFSRAFRGWTGQTPIDFRQRGPAR